ncbi:hypothetical protein TIFTF001_020006 [Ficus carica]|uniref:Uncharacterized protein n=1 Tax=Ficus carica TaxID=3494 RepID=A0AA88DJI5_FICCA|nr:hypothetical protein TIFTF001_020006 [Ficus carica]
MISAFSVAFVHTCVPEAKGKSLEQIEMTFESERDWQGGEVEMEDAERLVLQGRRASKCIFYLRDMEFKLPKLH